ncbi:MAG TPA: hypothetical protein DGT23_20550 [Micromonosporaceae bacterium]|nr:hypothetical protein [Micromonosporaceae bacterium]
MIKTETCYTVHCDDCKTEFENGDYTPHHPDGQSARWEAEESEWWTDGTIDLCHTCRLNPHAFILEPNTTDDCWRCSNPAEEHEVDPAGRVPGDPEPSVSPEILAPLPASNRP